MFVSFSFSSICRHELDLDRLTDQTSNFGCERLFVLRVGENHDDVLNRRRAAVRRFFRLPRNELRELRNENDGIRHPRGRNAVVGAERSFVLLAGANDARVRRLRRRVNEQLGDARPVAERGAVEEHNSAVVGARFTNEHPNVALDQFVELQRLEQGLGRVGARSALGRHAARNVVKVDPLAIADATVVRSHQPEHGERFGGDARRVRRRIHRSG